MLILKFSSGKKLTQTQAVWPKNWQMFTQDLQKVPKIVAEPKKAKNVHKNSNFKSKSSPSNHFWNCLFRTDNVKKLLEWKVAQNVCIHWLGHQKVARTVKFCPIWSHRSWAKTKAKRKEFELNQIVKRWRKFWGRKFNFHYFSLDDTGELSAPQGDSKMFNLRKENISNLASTEMHFERLTMVYLKLWLDWAQSQRVRHYFRLVMSF